MKLQLGMSEAGMMFSVLMLCIFRLFNSYYHIFSALPCFQKRLLNIILLQGGLLSLQKVFKLSVP